MAELAPSDYAYTHVLPWGWQDGFEAQLANLCSNLDPATNCHPGVSRAGQGINGCTIPWKVDNPEDQSASIAIWWTLKIAGYLSQRVSELSPAPRTN